MFNICTGQSTTVNKLAAMLGELLGRPVVIEKAPPPPEGDIRVSLGDPRQLMAEFGFACDISLRDGLRRTLKWLNAVQV